MPEDTKEELKKIAFVAMPFRTKPTGLKPGDGPDTVDFDALWERAVKPALLDLDYMPLRADEQTGSVIIKDMLTALVHAELVLADISIPNGNVYYEAGIRHAAKAQGCILMNANWSRPLFDLKQMTQVRYELRSSTPTDDEYAAIRNTLVQSIPALAQSKGPVFDLVQGIDNRADYHLRERTDSLYQFDTRLNAARISAELGDKEPLRSMLDVDNLSQLPGFALKELVDAVGKNLNWSKLVSVIDSLPKSVTKDAHFQEQKALGLSMGGNLSDAVGILEEVIKTHGKTCIRQGNLGGMYRYLAANKSSKVRMRYQIAAIEAYRSGMFLDLNDFYCSHKLLVLLTERGRSSDEVEALETSTLLGAALTRCVESNIDNEWLAPTQLIHAFYRKDTECMREISDQVLMQSWSNWKLMGLLTDLLSLLGLQADADLQEELQSERCTSPSDLMMLEICSELQSGLPVSQDNLLNKVRPLLDKPENRYSKQGVVDARLAIVDEEIVSITDTGEETSQLASQGDVVVRNNTNAQELYLIDAEVFEKRYDIDKPLTPEFQKCVAKGQSLAIEIDHEMTAMLGIGAAFYIHASWGQAQYAEEGDYFVCPLPEKSEIYRIGKPEFNATYVRSKK